MQCLALFVLWCLIGLSYAQLGIFDDLSLEEINPLDFTITRDSDWLFGETVGSNEADSSVFSPEILLLDESNPSLLSASDDLACDVSNADDMQLFDKKRRGSSCLVPFVGNTENQNEPSTQGDDFNSNNEPNQEIAPTGLFAPLEIFSDDVELCPPRIFKTSNIPVCRVFLPGTYILIPGVRYVTLLDVAPRRYFFFSCSPLNKPLCCKKAHRMHTVAVLSSTCVDSPSTQLWCCRELYFRVSNKFVCIFDPHTQADLFSTSQNLL